MKKKQVIRLTESDLHRVIKESVKNVLRESEVNDEECINAAIEALMSVRDVVSDATNCWEYADINEPLFQQICKASSAIEGVIGFSHYGKDLRNLRKIEQYEQD